jgi:hypothetical protein
MMITFVYFILQEGLAPIKLIIEDNFHRAAPGGTGGVKTIGNYASVTFASTYMKAIFIIYIFILGHHLLNYYHISLDPCLLLFYFTCAQNFIRIANDEMYNHNT